MIAQAAIRKDGVIHTLPRPARHPHVMAAGGVSKAPASNLERYFLADGEQGFITDAGEFLSRVAAAEHAIECGQIKPQASATLRAPGYLNHPPLLYSEDLW